MANWTADELDRIGDAQEVRLAPARRDGSPRRPVTIWVVRDGDALYVRSVRGAGAAWHRAATATHADVLRAAGLEREVALAEPADAGVDDRVDAGYRSKYRSSRYAEDMTAPAVRATTLRLEPRG
jgi:hypothetical protein